MAKIIEFYVPDPFPRKMKRVPSEQRGHVIEFPKSGQEVSLSALGKTPEATAGDWREFQWAFT
jgi:hypothetical protein